MDTADMVGKEARMVGAPEVGSVPGRAGNSVLGAGAAGLSHMTQLSPPEAGEVSPVSLPGS